MKLGTVVYDNKIYNLDYMNTEEVKELLKKIEKAKENVLSRWKENYKKIKSLDV